MKLQSLSITNFKNIASATLDFSPKINCFLGKNGMGKSNLLDAIHYLSFTRSYGRLSDSLLIKKDEDFAILNGKYLRYGIDEELNAGLRRAARKSFKRGGKEYKKISEHIGLFPCVMVAPADQNLIVGPTEERRRFIDMIISQTDAPYLSALIRYNHGIEQRNKMLREGKYDATLLDCVDDMLNDDARLICQRRKEHIAHLSEIFNNYYSQIAESDERVSITYVQSDGNYPSFKAAAEHNRTRDEILKYTGIGPHRDDISMMLEDMPVKQTASQGQSKTFAVALRLAQYNFISKLINQKPLLLLDDIFDKLDAERVANIISLVKIEDFGQIFITDTNRKHLDEIISRIGSEYRLWNVADGQFIPAGQ